MRKQALKIRLGGGWAFFSNVRPNMQMLGTVQDGMQIGALVQTAEGGYAQVNGDILRPLNTSKVEHALDSVTKTSRRQPGSAIDQAPKAQVAEPTIVVKKKRRIAIPTPT